MKSVAYQLAMTDEIYSQNRLGAISLIEEVFGKT